MTTAELILKRSSPRAIDPDRPVPKEQIDALFEAARWAPSASNRQPWFYVVFDDSDASALASARSWLDEGNSWALRAPVLVLVIARNHDERGANRFSQHDTGAATVLAALQAANDGLLFHQMAGYDSVRATSDLGLSDDVTAMSMIAIGHPGREDLLSDKDAAREHAPRRRKGLNEILMRSRWDR